MITEKMAELEQICKKLETGKTSLEESLVLYERGRLLAAECEEYLKTAEQRMTVTVINDEQATDRR
jgi:exodeoxyribonuclease VII small subunit